MQANDWQTSFSAFLHELPSELHEVCQQNWQRYYRATLEQHYILPKEIKFLQALWRLLAFSDYAASIFIKFVDYPERIYQTLLYPTMDNWQDFANDINDINTLMDALRYYRQYHMVRILWRDLLQLDSFIQHVQALTALADSVIQIAVIKLYQWLSEEWGRPQNEKGQEQPFIVIALGKLGGKELNFSSDIDLIFTYPHSGATVGKERAITNEQFFTKLGQQLIKVLSEVTKDGFVFRVDMRLRPHGQSGSLVMNYSALESYYQYQGRDWERYALIKSRVITGQKADAERFVALLQPFVYRRYLDYSAFAALREMKELVNSEIKRRNKEKDLKLGNGGIRQIEFLAQAIQLLRGGQEPQFREQNLLTVLSLIAKAKYISQEEYLQLHDAYIFLRQAEHRIQMMHDTQTHALPKEKIDRMRLAYMMGFSDEKSFKKTLKHHTSNVARQFNRISATPNTEIYIAALSSPAHYKLLWTELHDKESSIEILQKIGYVDAQSIWDQLRLFKDSHLIQSLKNQAALRLDSVMPALLVLLSKEKNASLLLNRMLQLLRSIVRRSAYLALLIEKPQVLKYLINICGKSEWILTQICLYPVLLDELLNPPSWKEMTSKSHMTQILNERLQRIAANDLEAQMEHLRQFKLGCFLSLAAHELLAKESIEVAKPLSDITEVILEQVYHLSLAFMIEHYQIQEPVESIMEQIPFGIVAYGNLGAQELNYASDLDLVFLFDTDDKNKVLQGKVVLTPAEFSLRLAQRIIHMLNVPTATGVLYDVDVRLRPGGSAGLLVSHVQAYQNYLYQHAWTWEYQALVKARCIIGPESLQEKFSTCRINVLSVERLNVTLARDIQQMRDKMYEHRNHLKQIDLKSMPGGIADIEFIVQYLVLRYAHDYPALLNTRSTTHLLQQLGKMNLLASNKAHQLIIIYNQFQIHLRRQILKVEMNGHTPTLNVERAIVEKMWQEIFPVAR
ncbi:bifunctional [glutamate--ammonia ligase]-adenylyl-L-tyrosine phosphorylase/[glutamate--ammonia-ligase] adenylyltransferase [Candidatus Berkiella aquae]|uniref:Bifunctional glutamine synthetase adenylyltransferase/adenylyl-removing enzyme n=1 Tax=Candidatus Berkiella aquae TaxID=295108 RepID=A0A0Q9YT75_9GAMM|nr:bifunctional [glutamate--ammonia ligase]-adenylyl-L-tyrosine phosphorylase/[glutamate--ammonia-ligase] adenylyltransferase [Candidatus Berkiella aquae]MCS5710130.1 bifunctional [glutamate--ammonia ligase]-adenylyl-L-tyrosine phosphorylase/[glutamate--ammonia-ligase] adenylyltransferase [Candidatus Berkiella aquae]